MIEIGTTDAMIEDTGLGLKTGGEKGLDPETGQRSPVGSAATHEREEGGEIKMQSETGQEIGGIGNGVGVGRSTGRGEVSPFYSDYI